MFKKFIIITFIIGLFNSVVFGNTINFRIPDAKKLGKDVTITYRTEDLQPSTSFHRSTDYVKECITYFAEAISSKGFKVKGYKNIDKEYMLINYGEGITKFASRFTMSIVINNDYLWLFIQTRNDVDNPDNNKWVIFTCNKS